VSAASPSFFRWHRVHRLISSLQSQNLSKNLKILAVTKTLKSVCSKQTTNRRKERTQSSSNNNFWMSWVRPTPYQISEWRLTCLISQSIRQLKQHLFNRRSSSHRVASHHLTERKKSRIWSVRLVKRYWVKTWGSVTHPHRWRKWNWQRTRCTSINCNLVKRAWSKAKTKFWTDSVIHNRASTGGKAADLIPTHLQRAWAPL